MTVGPGLKDLGVKSAKTLEQEIPKRPLKKKENSSSMLFTGSWVTCFWKF